jgi:hypothetical protein
MRKTAMNLTAVSIRPDTEPGSSQRLRQRRTPLGIGRTEPDNQEHEIQAASDRFLEGTICLPRDSLFPISPNRSTAPAGDNDRHARGPAPIALKEELHSTGFHATPGCE